MPNIKISELPEYTGSAYGTWFVIDNTGQTATYKIKRENFINGTSGTSGSSGYNGANGTSGSSGTSGTSGSSGSNGTSGSNGSDGSSGTSGSSGANGSSGTSGSSGANGSSGTSGSSGLSGDSIFALTGSVWNTTKNIGITGSFYQNGSSYFTGSIYNKATALTISSNTASLDLSSGSYFTLSLVSGSTTYINPTNIKPGYNGNLLITTNTGSNVVFPSTVKQISGSIYVPTQISGSFDILTFESFDTSKLFLLSVKNLL